MSTLEDFENAPFGATATQEETRARALRLNREFGETWIVAEPDGTFDTFESEDLVDGWFTLDKSHSQAWDEGFDAGERDAFDLLEHPDHECIPNPYRKEKNA